MQYWEARPELKTQVSDTRAKTRMRRFLQRALVSLRKMNGAIVPHSNHTMTTRQSYRARFRLPTVRRRAFGNQGAARKAPIVREQLFEWFSVLRHSLDAKVMARFPPKLVDLRAKELVAAHIQES